MTRRATEAAENIPNLPLLQEHENVERVGFLLVTGDRGLAGAFNSQIVRAANRRRREVEDEGHTVAWYASGRRGVSSIQFRGLDLEGGYTGFTDRPAYTDARKISDDLVAAYVDGKVDRVEMFYNGYISPLTQEVRREVLLPLQQADVLGDDEEEEDAGDGGQGAGGSDSDGHDHSRSLWIYEPDPEEILRRLAPDYVEISIYRALLESTASEHGARMTAMRSASENAADLIDDLTLEANRQRQADITQEIMEVVAGAEGLR
jgi:F-type H+-transporting ATPase subunit gamma